MTLEETETMHHGQMAPFQGDNIVFGRLNWDLGNKENNGKQQNTESLTDGTLTYEQLAWLQNYSNYFWSVCYPNLYQQPPHPLDGWVYPSSHGTYMGPQWLPQYPLQMVPQSYQPEINLQEFQYFVVIDFEATCDKQNIPSPQEIIEFPSVLVNGLTGQLEDFFQIYVRPTHNKQLTEFCIDLTGIQQSQVDKGVLLSDALLMHDKWLEKRGVKNTNFAIVTWSNWDCRVILESECRYKKISKPAYFNQWINLKIPFGKAFGGLRCNLKEAVNKAGLIWEGRPHCGLDDAKNTARLLVYLMACGSKLSITNNIRWISADHPTPPESGNSYSATPYKVKGPSHKNEITQKGGVAKESNKNEITQKGGVAKGSHMYCYCGAASVRKVLHKEDGFFVGCGKSTVKGPGCKFYKWVPASEPVKAAG